MRHDDEFVRIRLMAISRWC